MTSPLWEAAGNLAIALEDVPHFRAFRRAFDHRDDFAGRVSEITARYSPLRYHPILLGVRLNVLPDTAQLLLTEPDRQWLERAVESSTAFQVLIEGIRAELPGYPILRVPHLRQGSPSTFEDPIFLRGFPWDAELRRLGLQQAGTPPSMEALGGDDFVDLQRQLHRELKRRPAWQAFVSARDALTVDDRQALTALNKAFGASVQPEVVDREAGDLLMASHHYRLARLDELVRTAAGRVRTYLDAFEAVDLLISIVAAYMGTVIVHGGLHEVQPWRLALGAPDDARDVDFVVQGDNPFMNPSEVLVMSTSEPGASGIVYPTAVTHKWNRLDDHDASRMIITGKLVT